MKIENTNNVYMKARLKAAEYNDRLKSREKAADILGVHESSLTNYEKDLLKQIPPDVVVRMADLYNAPELMHHYCCNECPIGKCIAPNVELKEISYLAIQLSVLSKNPETFVQELMKILQDGVVSNDEKQDFVTIVKGLVEFSEKIQSLDLWAKKNLK
ncbi:helix-turn-helix domain-containing protein [Clostridium sp. WILCCON 0269]|uniref:Helix-turn-helix domain-containing protein n=1 Tax=Candidatus Clostridium eludens TaxID=3381663 RepID=A0ABW8SMQ3_9CLOT